ncbi:MAG: zf-HC2 domain-containing protein [Syntrophomonas sp.]|uniref:anti-sigma factor family protein n=1 Tax=Syntrophomonas sp. TaxID=2053627 RepID=UPI00260BDD75|nr:zf-HC2 domain-containing protein [Syntrophomonas sp.]MDD2509883.1 zf-HC2 domain-containing protein [Syntrophomonas sp.]MDD3878572.1 zf-HC2 domain-containing protein [Syntrophomonas sp.]MDD4626199.1 zf-HC2 domain-containing protein [Syntrophomonas sp.]
MKCEQARELLSPYIDEMTSEKETEALEAHLAQCANCRKELDDYRCLCGTMQRMESPIPPEDFAAVVQKRLQENKNKIFSARTIDRPKQTGWIAAVLAGVALAAGIYASSYLCVGDFLVSWQDKKDQKKPRIAIEDIIQRFQNWNQEEDNAMSETAEPEPEAKISSNPRAKASTGEGSASSQEELETKTAEDDNYSSQIMVKELSTALAQVIEIADGREIKYSMASGSYGNSEARRVVLEVEPQEVPQLLIEFEAIGRKLDVADLTEASVQDKAVQDFAIDENNSPQLLEKSEVSDSEKLSMVEIEDNEEDGKEELAKEKAVSVPGDEMLTDSEKGEDTKDIEGIKEKRPEGAKVSLSILIIEEK